MVKDIKNTQELKRFIIIKNGDFYKKMYSWPNQKVLELTFKD